MGKVPSGITWFGEDKWIEHEIGFGEDSRGSRWRVMQKFSERDFFSLMNGKPQGVIGSTSWNLEGYFSA
jgi:hypothetical protein